MEGTKYDDGKPRVGEMVQDFGPAMLELSKVWAFGADKYDKSNWKHVKNGETRYTNALLRHLIAEDSQILDSESNLRHAAHVAWNALARLWFILKKAEHTEIITIEGDTAREGDTRWIDYIKDFYDCNKQFIYEDIKKERLD